MSNGLISGTIGGVKLGDRRIVRIMGVLNLTRNSFYSGSVATTDQEISRAAQRLADEGADIIDVGARSTAPYRRYDIPVESEKRLLINAIKIVGRAVDLPISVDSTRYDPARSAIAEGAIVLNDVFGFTQRDGPRLASLIASKDLSLLTTAHEKRSRAFSNPMRRVMDCLQKSLEIASFQGIDPHKTVIDPGIGFFRDRTISNVEWNCSIIANLKQLRELTRPICVGISRKSFIGKILRKDTPDQRLIGSLGATAVAVFNGAHLIRTHDVAPTLEASKIVHTVREKGLIHYD